MRIISAILLTSLFGVATPAAAQNIAPTAAPNFGAVTLVAGFTPDPRIIRVTSGGTFNAAQAAGSHCSGHISRVPDVRLSYTAGDFPLIISAASAADTTLVIHGPDGLWHCDDDSGVNGLNPSIRMNTPRSGDYAIWIGSYRAGTNSRAELHISEVRSQ